MDSKNVLLAVILSTAVIVIWSVMFPPSEIENTTSEDTAIVEKNESKPKAPKIKIKEPDKKITRQDAIKQSDRINISNGKIFGTISLNGALIDDVTLKNYKETLNDDSKQVVILNPKKSENGYFLETGWATSENIKVPNHNSKWRVIGNNTLAPKQPVTIQWNNNEGLIFKKKLTIDDKYLIIVEDSVQNLSQKNINLFHYSQITRNKKPEVQNFYILHEGLIGVVGDELKELSYEDIIEKKETYKNNSGWFGITDKYWLSAIIPQKGKNFNAEFTYDKQFKANYIITDPTIINSNETKKNVATLFIGAKEVSVVDGYAEQSGINKFDLAIDWGWFFYFTKPIFFAIDYLYKISGNFGIAIILLTAAVRLIFFPLANYSFVSMAKMKALQPEMQRLKDLYKDDKQKIQMEMMNLYKREKVNPVSGCLPVLIQLPFFFAIYKVLFVTLEMRHAPFFGWIQDLSAPDPTTIFNLFGLIPWDPPSFLIIGIWPILMGLTMWIQQKLNPAPPDPIQAKIFMFFPFFLTILLASFPSGLVVYWTINNVLTMAQQYVIIRKTKTKTV
ncbi:MAG: membrane protein insertase YidC [Candidatus Pelagibacter sp.]|nr:membrane protein insertase YidC [Candidatus Pelagibacter sp.]|tara:strand:- start:5292 stop:6974 length:1683 start_codon:yes stop_codon:yes gene_type:complete